MLRCFTGGLGKKKLHMATLLTGRANEEIPQGLPIMVAYAPLRIANKIIFSLSGIYTCHRRHHSRGGKKSSHACSRSRGTIPGTILLQGMPTTSNASTRLTNLGVPFLFFLPLSWERKNLSRFALLCGDRLGRFRFSSNQRGHAI